MSPFGGNCPVVKIDLVSQNYKWEVVGVLGACLQEFDIENRFKFYRGKGTIFKEIMRAHTLEEFDINIGSNILFKSEAKGHFFIYLVVAATKNENNKKEVTVD